MQSKQREQKILAVVPLRLVLSKTRGSESVHTAERCGSHTGSKKPSAVHWQMKNKNMLELKTQKLFVAWKLGSGQDAEQDHKSEQPVKEGRC